MKKQASKPTTSAVTVQTGPLAGMQFTVEDSTPVEKAKMRVKYVAPNEGPRSVVEHVKVRGEFRESDKQEAVRIAFAKLIPASVQWQADRGYSDRTSGTPLAWDRQLGRFVVASKDPGNKTKETGSDPLPKAEKEG